MLATPLPPPGERKQVTVLVGEIEGLRTLRQAAAPEAVVYRFNKMGCD